MSNGNRREVDQIIRQVQQLGCTVRRGHHGWRVSRPGCQTITVNRSPSDARALANIRADIRRHLGITL